MITVKGETILKILPVDQEIVRDVGPSAATLFSFIVEKHRTHRLPWIPLTHDEVSATLGFSHAQQSTALTKLQLAGLIGVKVMHRPPQRHVLLLKTEPNAPQRLSLDPDSVQIPDSGAPVDDFRFAQDNCAPEDESRPNSSQESNHQQ